MIRSEQIPHTIQTLTQNCSSLHSAFELTWHRPREENIQLREIFQAQLMKNLQQVIDLIRGGYHLTDVSTTGDMSLYFSDLISFASDLNYLFDCSKRYIEPHNPALDGEFRKVLLVEIQKILQHSADAMAAMNHTSGINENE